MWCGESHPRPAVVVAGEVGERVVDVLCTDLSSAAEVEVPGRDRGVTGGQTPIVGRQPPSGIQLQFRRVNEVGAGVQVGTMTDAVPAVNGVVVLRFGQRHLIVHVVEGVPAVLNPVRSGNQRQSPCAGASLIVGVAVEQLPPADAVAGQSSADFDHGRVLLAVADLELLTGRREWEVVAGRGPSHRSFPI